MATYSVNEDFISCFKRMVLESENLLDLIEQDVDLSSTWSVERKSLENTISEAREELWPKGETHEDD